MKRRVNVMPLIANQPSIKIIAVLHTYRSFATRVSHNSKFGIFELLVYKETFADALLTGIVS